MTYDRQIRTPSPEHDEDSVDEAAHELGAALSALDTGEFDAVVESLSNPPPELRR